MSRDGSGNYNLPAGNPVVTGTVISSTQFNSTMTDIATAMTQSISKDGQTTPTNNLPMGGNKHTGVADGNLANQYASIGQTQNGSLNKATSVANVVDAFTAALTPAIASYTDGQVVTLVPSVTNTTTTVTLALNGLAAKPVNKEAGVACAIGDIVLNVPIYLVYTTQSSGYFLLLNPQKIAGPLVITAPSSGIAVSASGAANSYTAQLTGSTTSGQSFGLRIQAGTTSADTALGIANATSTATLAAVFGDGSFVHGVHGATSTLTGSAAGNVSIAAPGSGIAFSATGIANQYAGVFTAGGTAGAQKGLSAVTTTQNAADKIFNVNNSASNLLDIFGDGHGDLGPNLSWTVGGSWTINAPSSGETLILTAASGGDALNATGAAGASSSFGIAVQAGTNSSDYAINVRNQTGATSYFKVRGDGVVFGNDGAGNLLELGYKGTPLNSQGTNYTAVASDKGKTINGTASVSVTIPNSVFSAGDVLTVSVGSGAVVTIVQGSGVTLQWAGNGATTGSRTLTGAGLASILFLTASVALISGAGLS